MGFGDLKSDGGLQTLNSYLEDKSYIEGYENNDFVLNVILDTCRQSKSDKNIMLM